MFVREQPVADAFVLFSQTPLEAAPSPMPQAHLNPPIAIVLPEVQVAQLFDEALAFPGFMLTIDLERQVIVKAQGEEIAFPVEEFRKYCLINGLDDIGLTLRSSDKIKAFEAERLATKPWLNHTVSV